MPIPGLNLTRDDIVHLRDSEFRLVAAHAMDMLAADRKENQILYYQPASEGALKVHQSKAKIIGVGGGNRSSKTETCLVESVALATGVFPMEYHALFADKFRGPINVRIVCESLTTVMHPIILPKLQYWKWLGSDTPGDAMGHWGWVPKTCLIDGNWERSWSEKLRTLTVLCRDPKNLDHVLGESTFQIMAYNQDATDFASGTFHIVHMDEPPPYAIWRENSARVMDVGGRIMLSMTWPDDPSIPVDWIFDEVYDKGQPGPGKHPNIDWFELYTTDNRYIPAQFIAEKVAEWDELTKTTRIYGKPIRFSNRIHPLFTDHGETWCFACGKSVYISGEICPEGQPAAECPLTNFNHVRDFDLPTAWPVVFVLDPHPRKPHMWMWVVVDPSDDYWVVADGELDGSPEEAAWAILEQEAEMPLNTRLRLIDPNMGRSPSSATNRELTWQDEFELCNIVCDLADDSAIGRKRLNDYLKPDPDTYGPRIHIHLRCESTIHQMKRYMWDDYKRGMDRDIKQVPKDKDDDYPTMLKYLMNMEPTFHMLAAGFPVIRSRSRKSA